MTDKDFKIEINNIESIRAELVDERLKRAYKFLIDTFRYAEREYREESMLEIPPKKISGKMMAHQMLQEGNLSMSAFLSMMDAIEHCYNPYEIVIKK